MANALSDKERALMDAYWHAANYLSVGQIYLYDNPLVPSGRRITIYRPIRPPWRRSRPERCA
jgi:phosphoketolase